MPTEEAIAASSFILSLYNDCESVLNAYSSYLNVLVRIQDKYQMKNTEKREQPKLEEEDEGALLTVTETLRVWVTRCFIKASSLSEKIPDMKKELPELKKLYEKVISTSIIEKEIAESFVLTINKAFVSGVLKDLLVQSRDIYKELLKGE